MMRVLGGTAALISVVVACSSYDSTEPANVGLDAGATPDAMVAMLDASFDAKDDVAPPSFCESAQASFCTTFENDVPFGFDQVTGAIGVSSDGLASSHALELANAAGEDTTKSVAWTFRGETVSTMKIWFAMRIVATPDRDSADAVLLRVDCNGENFLQLKLNENHELKVEAVEQVSAVAATNRWGTVEVAVNAMTGAAILQGDLLTVRKPVMAKPSCPAPVTFTLGFSSWVEAPAGPYAVLLDDFAIDVK